MTKTTDGWMTNRLKEPSNRLQAVFFCLFRFFTPVLKLNSKNIVCFHCVSAKFVIFLYTKNIFCYFCVDI